MAESVMTIERAGTGFPSNVMALVRERYRRPWPWRVDFLRNNAAITWLIVLLWLFALLAGALVWGDWLALHQREADTALLEDRFEALAARQERALQAVRYVSPVQREQMVEFAKQKASPQALLDRISMAWSPQMALLRLDVDTLSGQANLDIEARTLEEEFSFVQRLKHLGHAEAVLQQDAQKTNDPDRAIGVRLRVSAP
jgi:hypothetical protein